ncbi:hypothetical protein CRUP_033648 [Coryphaenoides rupestris]|nr:hypothetical protein CRUP_033648 [Coryphaenoides rupestris]
MMAPRRALVEIAAPQPKIAVDSSSSGGQWRGRTDEPQEPSVLTSDLKYLQEDLQLKKANVFRSIPYSRFGSNRDAHCYRKAYPHLLAFKVSCQEWGTVLLRSGQWDLALEYGLLAWRYAGELPTWDTAGHNTLREHCYAALAAHCLAALRRRHGDAATEPAKARELLRRLKMAQQHSRAIDPCIHELERILEHGGGGDSAMDTQ